MCFKVGSSDRGKPKKITEVFVFLLQILAMILVTSLVAQKINMFISGVLTMT